MSFDEQPMDFSYRTWMSKLVRFRQPEFRHVMAS